MKTKLTYIFLIFFFCCYSVSATDYYVSNDGNDANDGLSPLTPWNTIGKVNNNIEDGDNVYLDKGSVFPEKLVLDNIDGTQNNWVTVDAYGIGENPKFTGRVVDASIEIHNGNYITIKNIDFENVRRLFWIEDSSNIIIDNVHGHDYSGWGGSQIRDSNNLIVRNSEFESTNEQSSGQDSFICNGVSYALFENNSFLHASHTGLTLYGGEWDGDSHGAEWIIVRDNEFKDWRRGFGMLYWQDHTLIENNKITIEFHTSEEWGDIAGGCNQFGSVSDLIIRNNLFKDSFGTKALGGWLTDQLDTPVDDVYVYNNIFDSDNTNGDLKYVIENALYSGPLGMSNMYYVNNYIKATNSDIAVKLTKGIESSGSFSNLQFKDNFFSMPVDNFVDIYDSGHHYYTLETLQGSSPPNSDWLSFEGNTQVSQDVILDDKYPLTYTTLAEKSNTIYVDNANYFYPTIEICGETIKGDTIYVGDNMGLEIETIDYDTDCITINRIITYGEGDSVGHSESVSTVPGFEMIMVLIAGLCLVILQKQRYEK